MGNAAAPPVSSGRRLELLLRHPLSQIGAAYLAVLFGGLNFASLRTAAAFHWNDFGKFYYAVAGWQAGASLYAPSVATHLSDGSVTVDFLDLNPPHFHFLLLPLVNFELGTAARVWLALNLVAAAASCRLVLLELGIRIERWQWLPLIALCLGSTATMANAVTAQCTGLLMPLLTLAWIAARRDRWLSSGLCLGILVSVKPFLGLFLIAFLLKRQWRGIAAMCASGVICALSGSAYFGWQSYFAWMEALRAVSWVWAGMNGSLLALLTKSLSGSPTLTPVFVAPSLITPLWVAGVALVCFWSIRALSWSVDHLFAVTLLASLVISPLGWIYYLWLALPPCLALWQQRTSACTWAGLAFQCIPLLKLGIGQPFSLATVFVASAYAWTMLLLWLDVASIRRTASTSPTSVRVRANDPASISTTT